MKIIKPILVASFLVVLLCGFTPNIIRFHRTCYYFTADSEDIAYKPDELCTGTILCYKSHPEITPSNCTSCDTVIINVHDDDIPYLSLHFSDDELQDIIDRNSFSRSLKDKGSLTDCALRLPAFSLASDEGAALADQIFTTTAEYIIMHNPITDKNVYLHKIDYIKYNGISLIPVPPLSN